MSIREVITSWVVDGNLIIFQPALASAPYVRTVIATREVTQKLCGPWDDDIATERFTQARAVVDAFISGLAIATRFPPSTSARAQLALLTNEEEEVWEFRSRKPKPGVRVFGHFAEKDLFVALTIELRENIDETFTYEKESCKREWRIFFPSYKPFRADWAEHYLSNHKLV